MLVAVRWVWLGCRCPILDVAYTVVWRCAVCGGPIPDMNVDAGGGGWVVGDGWGRPAAGREVGCWVWWEITFCEQEAIFGWVV